MDTTQSKEDKKVARYKSDNDKLIECGINYISPKTKQKIPAWIEFTMKKDIKAYPIWAELIALLGLLQATDPKIKAIASNDSSTWTDFTKIPLERHLRQN
eukprot:15281447-Ditylum_brightwellii.AAC.1